MAAWPSGKAEDCKSFTPSSNLGAALHVESRLALGFAGFCLLGVYWDFGEFYRTCVTVSMQKLFAVADSGIDSYKVRLVK
jgi:hypothetical protein